VGVLAKKTTASLAGTLAGAGTLVKRAGKALAGTLATAGIVSSVRPYLLALAGTLTVAGALARSTTRSVAGTLVSAGALAKRTARSLAGTLALTGAATAIPWVGAIGPSIRAAVDRLKGRAGADVTEAEIRGGPVQPPEFRGTESL